MQLLNQRYQKLSKVGEGSFAKVFIAMDQSSIKKQSLLTITPSNENCDPNKQNEKIQQIKEEQKKENNQGNQYLAIKKLKSIMYEKNLKDYGGYKNLPEIQIIKSINHTNIINIIDMFEFKSNFYIIQPLCCCDLSFLLKKYHNKLSYSDRQQIMLQVLKGVAEIHKNQILHRDLKPHNLLITKEGVIKIADFGISKQLKENSRPMTKNMVTRFYRPPEIIYGSTQYGLEVDIWSLGCLFAEIMKGAPLFPGASDIDQLDKIFSLLGSPTEKNWPGCSSLPFFLEFQEQEAQDFKTLIPEISLIEENFLKKLLVLDPKKRITIEQLSTHTFFQEAEQNKSSSTTYLQLLEDIYQQKISKYQK